MARSRAHYLALAVCAYALLEYGRLIIIDPDGLAGLGIIFALASLGTLLASQPMAPRIVLFNGLWLGVQGVLTLVVHSSRSAMGFGMGDVAAGIVLVGAGRVMSNRMHSLKECHCKP